MTTLYFVDSLRCSSSNTDKVLSVNLSANVFCILYVFERCNVDYSKISTSDSLTLVANFPIRIPGCDVYSPALPDLCLISNFNLCFVMVLPPLGTSDVA